MEYTKVLLGDISTSVNYGLSLSATKKNTGIRFLRITDIQDNKVNWNGVPYCHANETQKQSCSLSVGDIVFARTGATTGKSFLIKELPSEEATFASYLIRLKVSEKILPDYLYHFFQSPVYWLQISGSSSGATLPGVNSTKLKSLQIPLPPLPEQKRIVAILDQAHELKEKRKQAIAKLDELVQAVFIDMFGDPVENPMGWEVSTLDGICSLITDGVHLKPTYVSDGVPFISVKDITTGELKFDDCKFIDKKAHEKFTRRCKPEYNDILYTKVGATYGRPCIVTTKKEFSIYVSVALLKPKRDLIIPQFLVAQLALPAIKQQADKRIKGIGVPDLHLIEIKSFQIMIPPLKIQREYEAIIVRLKEQKERLVQSLKCIDTLISSLSQTYFS